MVESLLFIGAGAGVGAGVRAGAGEKIPGAGQKRTGSTTLPVSSVVDPITLNLNPDPGLYKQF